MSSNKETEAVVTAICIIGSIAITAIAFGMWLQ